MIIDDYYSMNNSCNMKIILYRKEEIQKNAPEEGARNRCHDGDG